MGDTHSSNKQASNPSGASVNLHEFAKDSNTSMSIMQFILHVHRIMENEEDILQRVLTIVQNPAFFAAVPGLTVSACGSNPPGAEVKFAIEHHHNNATSSKMEVVLHKPSTADFKKFLLELECLAFALLSDGKMNVGTYLLRRGERSAQGNIVASEDSWLSHLHANILECLRVAHGPVGLYWLLPLLYAMYHDKLGISNAEDGMPKFRQIEVNCDRDEQLNETTSTRFVCEGLPVNCRVEVTEYPYKAWTPYSGLVAYLFSFQCSMSESGQLSNAALDPEQHTLYLLTAGSIPLACAIVEYRKKNGNAFWHIHTFCSVPGTRAGHFLLRRMSQRAAAQNASLSIAQGDETAQKFYAAHGFDAREQSNKKQYGSLSSTVKRGLTRTAQEAAHVIEERARGGVNTLVHKMGERMQSLGAPTVNTGHQARGPASQRTTLAPLRSGGRNTR